MQPEWICMQMRYKRQVGLGNSVDDVLCRTPFDPLFHLRIWFTSKATSSPGCDGVCPWSPSVCKPMYVAIGGKKTWYILPFVAEHKSPIVSDSPPLSLFLWKGSQFVGDTSLVGIRISVGGHRSAGGGSDKLWNVKDQFLPHVSVLGEHCQAVSRHHV